MLNFLVKTATAVIKVAIGLPLAVVADIAVLGGVITDKPICFSCCVISSAIEDLKNSLK